MSHEYSGKWCSLTTRYAIFLSFILVLSGSKMVFADWESFKTSPVDAAGSQTIRGFVSKPEGTGPFPAVVIAHGCVGVEQNHFEWAQRLVSWGYVSIIVDSFGLRKVDTVCSNPYRVSPETRAYDVYGAAAYLRKQSFVDFEKIGLIGFSHGGWTALCAAQRKFSKRAQEAPFRAVIAYYPWCPWLGLKETNTPLLVLMGKDDDWTPLSRCKALLAAQEDAYKKNVSLIAYDNAYHDFDDSSKEPAEEYDGHFLAFNKEAAAQSINEAKTFFARYLD